jgi:hypothetical protein
MQRGLFAVHPEVYDLGCGGTFRGFIDSSIHWAVEYQIRQVKSRAYRGSEVRNSFESHFAKARERNQFALLSHECLTLGLFHEVDVEEKARRVYDVFGAGTKVLVVLREQWSLLFSLYDECVMCGLGLTYRDFIDALLARCDSGMLLDLDYAGVVGIYEALFGVANTKVVLFEDLVRDQEAMLGEITDFFGIARLSQGLPCCNPGRPKQVVEAVRTLNQGPAASAYGLGRSLLEPALLFRSIDVHPMRDRLASWAAREFEARDMRKRRALELVKAHPDAPSIDTTIDDDARAILTGMFRRSNSMLPADLRSRMLQRGYAFDHGPEPPAAPRR